MLTLKVREVVELVSKGLVKDLTYMNTKLNSDFVWFENGHFVVLGIGKGLNGVNCCLLSSGRGVFAITKPNRNLFKAINSLEDF